MTYSIIKVEYTNKNVPESKKGDESMGDAWTWVGSHLRSIEEMVGLMDKYNL